MTGIGIVLSVHWNVFRVYEHQNGIGGFWQKLVHTNTNKMGITEHNRESQRRRRKNAQVYI